jgi:hypothetical protein
MTFEDPHPLAAYDCEKELALLRESIAETKAGVPGTLLREATAQTAAELNLPSVEVECVMARGSIFQRT